MKINRIIAIGINLFYIGICGAIDLEPAKKTVIASFPIGTDNGALSLRIGEPYEPEAPTQVLISPLGDTLILDFYQGVLIFDSNFDYKGILKSPGFNRIALSDAMLLLWNSISSISSITLWPVQKTGYGTLIPFRFPESTVGDLYVRESVLFYTINPKTIKAIMLQGGNIVAANEKTIIQLVEKHGLSINGGRLTDKNKGLITESAELFFLKTSNQELVFANVGQKKDTVNLAMGSIFAVDRNGLRFICYMQDGKGRIAIADKEGRLIKAYDLLVGVGQDTKLSIPCFAPDGSIRYLESNTDGHRLISIRKEW